MGSNTCEWLSKLGNYYEKKRHSWQKQSEHVVHSFICTCYWDAVIIMWVIRLWLKLQSVGVVVYDIIRSIILGAYLIRLEIQIHINLCSSVLHSSAIDSSKCNKSIIHNTQLTCEFHQLSTARLGVHTTQHSQRLNSRKLPKHQHNVCCECMCVCTSIFAKHCLKV